MVCCPASLRRQYKAGPEFNDRRVAGISRKSFCPSRARRAGFHRKAECGLLDTLGILANGNPTKPPPCYLTSHGLFLIGSCYPGSGRWAVGTNVSKLVHWTLRALDVLGPGEGAMAVFMAASREPIITLATNLIWGYCAR